MTQDEIIAMSIEITQQFGVRMTDEYGETHGEELYCMGIDDIVEAIKLVAAHEREACAKIVEENANKCGVDTIAWMLLSSNADAIRARNNND